MPDLNTQTRGTNERKVHYALRDNCDNAALNMADCKDASLPRSQWGLEHRMRMVLLRVVKTPQSVPLTCASWNYHQLEGDNNDVSLANELAERQNSML